jgi:hypothetical protein
MDPRYPIGKYEPQPFSEKLKQDWINDIQFLPQAIENALHNLDEAQQNTPYREGGWTVKQLVHHVADSHMNAYIRFKLGLTENNPVIKPYEEGLWAQLSDAAMPTNISVTLLHALHARWHHVLMHIQSAEWDRTVYHPASKKEISLWNLLGTYSWHSRHHTAHITQLRASRGW